MPACRICQTPFEPFLEFGEMPIANGFLTPEEVEDEYTYELSVGVCPSCWMVQLVDHPDPEQMFHDEYAYFSSTSEGMKRHFRGFAEWVIGDLLEDRQDPFVVEIGSNDGIMLRHISEAGIQHLGVEPSQNVGEAAVEKGVRTIFEFFDRGTAEEIVAKDGPADAILAANVIAHIPDLTSVLAGVETLLAPEGRFIFENHYLGDMLDKTAYDQIYSEHIYHFSLTSVSDLLARFDLEVIDVQPQPVHGGSMRYVVAHTGVEDPTPAVEQLRDRERSRGLDEPSTYKRFADAVQRSRDRLRDLLSKLRQEDARIVGYGATAKSTTVLNFCDLGTEHIEFISDATPAKQDKLTPGTHIPVKAPDSFREDYPDYAILFAWNHADEIMGKETAYTRQGGKWITYVPQVAVVD